MSNLLFFIIDAVEAACAIVSELWFEFKWWMAR